MDWLGKIGEFFGALTNPIDMLMSWIVSLAMEGMMWVLGSVVKIMKLTDGFYDVKITKDLFAIVEYACYILVVAVATYYVFSVLLDMATGGSGESPMVVFGKFINYGFRVLSMPFLLFTFITVNSKFIDVLTAYGVDVNKFSSKIGAKGTDSTAFIKTMGTLFSVSQTSLLLPALFGLGIAIVFFILLFQLIRRTGDVFFLYILIPPVALTVFTKDLDMYPSWVRQLITVIGGQTVQVIGLYAGMQMVMEGHGIMGMGVLLATISTPAVIKEFAYNSGKGGGGFSQLASSGLMMLAR